MALKITDSNITETLKNNQITVIDFWAEWCGPCRMLAPIIEELSADNPDLAIGKLNVDENHITTNQYGIRGIPAIFFFKDGVLVDRLVGMTQKDKLQAKIDALVG